MNSRLHRRGFGSLLLGTAGAVIVRPRFGLGATDDPPSPLRTVGVHNAKQFDKALADAQPGDHIVLANGTYDGDRTLSRGGIAQAPVVILAASKHKATLTGTLTLAGAHTIAYGLRFAGDSLGVQFAADDTAVLRCWFVGPRGTRATSQKRVRVGYNRFSGGPLSSQTRPHQIHFDIPDRSSVLLPEGGRVYRNDLSSASGSGASEETHHIYVGDSGGGGEGIHPSLTDFQIGYNRISDSVRRRGIYTKRGGTIEFNHVQGRGPGVTGIRAGGRGAFSGNRCDNIDSVIINGPDHQVRGNWVRARKGLRLECEYVSVGGGLFNAAHRAMVVGNDATLTVGYFPPDSTLIALVNGVQVFNHTGSVVLTQQENTTWIRELRPDLTYPAPVTLLPGEVGPDAP